MSASRSGSLLGLVSDDRDAIGKFLNPQALRGGYPLGLSLFHEPVHLRLMVVIVRESVVNLGRTQMRKSGQDFF